MDKLLFLSNGTFDLKLIYFNKQIIKYRFFCGVGYYNHPLRIVWIFYKHCHLLRSLQVFDFVLTLPNVF